MFRPIGVALRIGMSALRASPTRTALATLGVIIGSGALVSILSVSDGVEAFARTRIGSEGFDRLSIRSITEDVVDGQSIPRATPRALTLADLDALPGALLADERAQFVVRGSVLVELGRPARARGISLIGVATVPGESGRAPVEAGRSVSPTEARGEAPVAEVSLALAMALSEKDSSAARVVIGDSLRVGGAVVRIIGVSMPSDASLLSVTVSVPVAQRVLALQTSMRFPTLSVITSRAENVQAMRARVERWLGGRIPQWEDAFRIEARAESQLAEMRRGLMVFRLLMGSITGITLIVGGIGIMNVLLAAVAERTREIGVRKAVGATRVDVLLQFLAESVVITGLGACVGTLLGLGTAYGLTAVMRARTTAEVYAATTPQTLAISAGLALFVGIAFGAYPALRAARLAPIKAIHTE